MPSWWRKRWNSRKAINSDRLEAIGGPFNGNYLRLDKGSESTAFFTFGEWNGRYVRSRVTTPEKLTWRNK